MSENFQVDVAYMVVGFAMFVLFAASGYDATVFEYVTVGLLAALVMKP